MAGVNEQIPPQTRALIRKSAFLFLVIGIVAFGVNIFADAETPLRYVVGSVVLICFSASVLFYVRE
jgi:hypothetical protein